MLKETRERAGLSQEELAKVINCDRSTISRAESKDYAGTDIILGWSKACNAPELILWYCKSICPIGQAYCYEVLDSIDSSMPSVILTGVEELQEALAALERFGKLVRNRRCRAELSQVEQLEAEDLLQQFAHDISRYADIVKLSAAAMGFDLELGVKANDQKAINRGYIKKKSAMHLAVANY